jgi:hypothetical protein
MPYAMAMSMGAGLLLAGVSFKWPLTQSGSPGQRRRRCHRCAALAVRCRRFRRSVLDRMR